MAVPTAAPARTASPEYFDVEDEQHPPTAPTTQWQQQQDQLQASPSGAAAAQPRNTPLMQKRRRVTRACDECRRKKIKCDGKQPCTHCTVYSYGNVIEVLPTGPC
jgi:hypothetical protein